MLRYIALQDSGILIMARTDCLPTQGIAIAMVIFGNWQIALLSDYFRAIFHRIPVMFS